MVELNRYGLAQRAEMRNDSGQSTRFGTAAALAEQLVSAVFGGAGPEPRHRVGADSVWTLAPMNRKRRQAGRTPNASRIYGTLKRRDSVWSARSLLPLLPQVRGKSPIHFKAH